MSQVNITHLETLDHRQRDPFSKTLLSSLKRGKILPIVLRHWVVNLMLIQVANLLIIWGLVQNHKEDLMKIQIPIYLRQVQNLKVEYRGSDYYRWWWKDHRWWCVWTPMNLIVHLYHKWFPITTSCGLWTILKFFLTMGLWSSLVS